MHVVDLISCAHRSQLKLTFPKEKGRSLLVRGNLWNLVCTSLCLSPFSPPRTLPYYSQGITGMCVSVCVSMPTFTQI